MKNFWPLIFLLLSPWIIQAQSNQEEAQLRTTEVTATYGVGGIWYLNALDPIPKWGVTVEHYFIQEYVEFGLRGGYEYMEETTFLPLGAAFRKDYKKNSFKGFIGYAFALNDFAFENDEIEVRGGLCADIHYGYTILSLSKLKVKAVVGYQFRRSVIVYEADPTLEEIISRQYFHHLNIGFALGF